MKVLSLKRVAQSAINAALYENVCRNSDIPNDEKIKLHHNISVMYAIGELNNLKEANRENKLLIRYINKQTKSLRDSIFKTKNT